MKYKSVLHQLIPPTPGPLPEADGTNRSIVGIEPQSHLYPVHAFERDFQSLLSESELSERYKSYFTDPAEEKQARERCDLTLEINEVNDIFGDPTVLGLLNEWQNSLHQRHIEEEQEGLRPTWSSVYGQIEDTTEYGDGSTAHYKEPLKIQPTGGSQLTRMLNDSTRGKRRVRQIGRSDRFGGPNSSNQQIPQSTTDNSEVERTSSTTPKPSTSEEASASTSINPEAIPTIPTESLNQPKTGADILKILHGEQPDEELYQQNVRLVQELSQNADKHVERKVQESRFLKTPMETNFQRLSLKLESSPLKSLALGSRIDIPIGHRPQINYVDPEAASAAQKPPIGDPTLLSNEVVLNIVFYKAHRPSQPMQEFMVLGSQRLSVLRDAFHCVMDFITQGADDAQRSALVQNTRTKKTSNSFMMIEGVFYNDSPLLRAKIEEKHRLLEEQEQEQLSPHQSDREGAQGDADADASGSRRNVADTPIEDVFVRNHAEYARHSLDYSQVILDWIQESPERKNDPAFKYLQKGYMHDTKIRDLAIRLDHPYLFVHQGSCEHILMVKSMRLLNKEYDDMNRANYPRLMFKSKPSTHMCKMCLVNRAQFVTIDDRLAGESPCYFCQQCYYAFHYDIKGNLLYDDFRVFPYVYED
ncbi:small nuclear RNA activating complex, polypeptide 3 [Podila epicladia]|nr:small nuclear RNA activating complex, polypeptide 3 [Podila epicladia]KAG0094670.1 small nuclear RNA activating complex, polypeptide 3 [Podila epicladia]